MSELIEQKTKSDQGEIARQEDEDNLAYFWHEAGGDEVQGNMDEHDKRLKIEPILWLQLEELQHHPDASNERNGFVNEFKNWYPRTRQEAQAAMGGAVNWINSAAYLKNVDTDKVRAKRFKAIRQYWAENGAEFPILNSVIVASEESGDEPSAELIRGSSEVLNLIADQLQARESLDKGEWLARNTRAFKDRRKYWRGLMQAAGQFAGDKLLLELYEDVREKTKERYDYWTREFGVVEKSAGGIAAKQTLDRAEVRTVPVTEEVPEARMPVEIEPVREETDWDALVPPVEQEHMNRRREEYAARVEHLDHAGMPQAEKIATLDREFPEFVPVERSDYRDVKVILAANAKLNPSGKSTRPRVTRSNLSAAGKRIADDDRQLEFDRKAAEGRL